jgi:hypothetical protein
LTEAEARSQLACPVCGQHWLAIARPPHIAVMGVQPYSDLLGLGDREPDTPPAIECLACGTRWRDIDAFNAGKSEPPPPPAPPEAGEEAGVATRRRVSAKSEDAGRP